MITILDYEAGNLRSVARAFERAGVTPVITSDEKTILASEAVVLPGVGAFGDCMQSLNRKGLDGIVKSCIGMGKPFLGICLGFQMLFESSEEHANGEADIPGLGIFKGRVRRFPAHLGLKVPHMGWNSLEFPKSCRLFEGLGENPYVYFVHSYYVDAADKSIVSARANYGISFDAAVARDNVYAVQFHPEKSGEVGLAMISNFVKVVKNL